MDPVEAWIDAEEVKRLAESLSATSPSQLLTVESAEAAYGEAFVGFDAEESDSVQVIESPAEKEEPLKIPPNSPPEKEIVLEEPKAVKEPEAVAPPAAPIQMGSVTQEAKDLNVQEEIHEEQTDEDLSDQPLGDQEKAIIPPAAAAALAAAASSGIMGPLATIKADDSKAEPEKEKKNEIPETASKSEAVTSFKDTSHLGLGATSNSSNVEEAEEEVIAENNEKSESEEDREATKWFEENEVRAEGSKLKEEKVSPPQPYPFKKEIAEEASEEESVSTEEITKNQLNPTIKKDPVPATSDKPKVSPFDTPTKPASSFPANEEAATKGSIDGKKELAEAKSEEKPKKAKRGSVLLRDRVKRLNQSKSREFPLVSPFDPERTKTSSEEAVKPMAIEQTEVAETPEVIEAPKKPQVKEASKDAEILKTEVAQESSVQPKEIVEIAEPKVVTPPLVTEKTELAQSAKENPQVAVEESPVAPFLTRLEEFGGWLKNETPTQKFFILDRDGKILIDEVKSLNLQKISRTLANHTIAVQRRGGQKASPSAHLKIGDASYLEVIPTKSKYGNLILGCIVPESMTPEGAAAVAHNLLLTANQGI